MMRRAGAFLGALLLVAWGTAASAQAKPDLSGKWVVDTEKTAAANPAMPEGGPGGRGMGMGPLTLTLEGNTLVRESEGRNGMVKTSFTLDGAEHTVSMGMGEAKVKAGWKGEQLEVTSTRETPRGEMTTRTTYARDGEWLVVTTTMPTPQGERSRTVYYRKG